MRLKSFIAITAFFLITLPSLSFASKKREIIIGFGGGYSLALQGKMKYEYDFPKEIYFKEKVSMKHSLSANIQYYFTSMWGLQLEFSQQKGRYFSHLEWYGKFFPNPFPPPEYFYTEINHIEKPYRETWSLSSITLSVFIVWRRSPNQRIYPYASAGGGIYILSGDEKRIRQRWRLGIKKLREKIKIGAGLKYRLSARWGLNLRIFVETYWRRSVGYGERLYIGSDQFDFELYLLLKEIARVGEVIEKTFSSGGIDISLEFKL